MQWSGHFVFMAPLIIKINVYHIKKLLVMNGVPPAIHTYGQRELPRHKQDNEELVHLSMADGGPCLQHGVPSKHCAGPTYRAIGFL